MIASILTTTHIMTHTIANFDVNKKLVIIGFRMIKQKIMKIKASIGDVYTSETKQRWLKLVEVQKHVQ